MVKLADLVARYLGLPVSGRPEREDGETAVVVSPETRSGLPASIARWPEEWRYLFDERAAMAQFHGGLPKEEAEHGAEADVRRQFKEEEG